ncbi:MAG TPA: hypothetical protein VM534_03255 [Thermoanaerobaculia bacterium]|nr:hypothetical protein [Thermoanaerobaculia bacterium]
MIGLSGSRARAAVLTVAMNLVTVGPRGLFRYLQVPGIHFILRREIRRRCSSGACHRRRHGRSVER